MMLTLLTQASNYLESFPFDHRRWALSCGLILVGKFTVRSVRLFRKGQTYKAVAYIPGINVGLALFCEAVWPSAKVLLLWIDCLTVVALLCSAFGPVCMKALHRLRPRLFRYTA